MRGKLAFTTIMLSVWIAIALMEQTPAWALRFRTLHSFDYIDGANPEAGLIQAANRDIYGTTSGGGASGDGTVFKITANSVLTMLESLDGADGQEPFASLIQAIDGSLYATTIGGGTNNEGTVFEITKEGTFIALDSFDGMDGAEPFSGLIQATDGNLYGTTTIGGANGAGTVFYITPDGTLTTIYNFCSRVFSDGVCLDGEYPYGALTQGTDGNLYGTTTVGGSGRVGTVFEIRPKFGLKTLHTFQGADGEYPTAGLIQATDGNFYGTTTKGGAFDLGTVYQYSSSGTLTVLFSFDGADGKYPYAQLIQATDGNLYGTTQYGGLTNSLCPSGCGTVFSIGSNDTLTTLYNFCSQVSSNNICLDGANPKSLVQATNESLYGTTVTGGANDFYGTIFEINP